MVIVHLSVTLNVMVGLFVMRVEENTTGTMEFPGDTVVPVTSMFWQPRESGVKESHDNVASKLAPSRVAAMDATPVVAAGMITPAWVSRQHTIVYET